MNPIKIIICKQHFSRTRGQQYPVQRYILNEDMETIFENRSVGFGAVILEILNNFSKILSKILFLDQMNERITHEVHRKDRF